MTFIERLDVLMKENGVSQKVLAEACGIGKNQFAYWKKNGNVPSGTILEKIANYFGVSVDYLLGKTDKKENSPAVTGGADEEYYLLANRAKSGEQAIQKLTKEEYEALVAVIKTFRSNSNDDL